MEIVNIIASDSNTGKIISVDPFPVLIPELSDEVNENANQLFTDKCLANGLSMDEIDDGIIEGFLLIPDENILLSIVVSHSVDN